MHQLVIPSSYLYCHTIQNLSFTSGFTPISAKTMRYTHPPFNVTKIFHMISLLLHNPDGLMQGHHGAIRARYIADAHTTGLVPWAQSLRCDLSWFPPSHRLSASKHQPHKLGEDSVLIRTRVSIHLSYKMFKFKGLPTGTPGLSTVLVQTLPVYEYYLL